MGNKNFKKGEGGGVKLHKNHKEFTYFVRGNLITSDYRTPSRIGLLWTSRDLLAQG